jgi:hypothetical protein
MNFVCSLVGAAFLSVVALCSAAPSADAPLPRPQIKAGDSWSYRYVDYWTNKQILSFRESVSFANDRVIQMVDRPYGKKKEIDTTYTAEWNVVSSPNAGFFNPDHGFLKFPLRVGDTHDARYVVKFPLRSAHGIWQVRHERHVKVVGWEDVTVPAGTFHALRIEGEGSFERLDTTLSGTAKEIMWYAPEVRRYVKWTFENSTPHGRNQWWGWELLDYELQ